MNAPTPKSITAPYFRNRYLLALTIAVVLVAGLSAVFHYLMGLRKRALIRLVLVTQQDSLMSGIEYFYSAHSAFAYLGSARLSKIASASDRVIVHKPMDLLRVMAESGAGLTRERSDRHRAYYFGREIERWAEWRNAPVVKGLPTNHRKDMTLCNCVLIAAIEQDHNIDHFAHRMLEAHWRDNADLTDRETLVRLANEVDLDPLPLLAAAVSPAITAIYVANTEEAINRSVFGSPTYFVDGDMFYGQDHLEFVERALEQPFKGVWPPDKS